MSASSRMAYLDNLKLFLTVLVIAHHTAITYGAAGSWFYLEPTSSFAYRAAGTLFTSTNQFYFMGLFFFLAGYFTPRSLARKGGSRFVRDRLVRLGIPLVVFALFVSPYVEHVSSLRTATPSQGYVDELVRSYEHGDFRPGPLWFVETLLVFAIVYAFLSPPPKPPREPERVTHAQLFTVAALVAAGSFVVRLFTPVGREWHHLQLAYYPQYVVLFALGTMAEHRGWLEALEARLLRVWIPLMIGVFAFLTAALVLLLPRGKEAVEPWLGGFHVEALALAVLESVWCVGASVTALVVFRAWLGGRPRWARALVPDAYAVYVIHAPIIVAIALAIRGVTLDPFLKFAIVTALGTVSCFAASHFVLRKSALVRRVL